MQPRNWERILRTVAEYKGEQDSALARLPFGPGDTTAGSETELQTAVIGDRRDVDLPRAIESSRYYANLLKRSAAEDVPKRSLCDLQRSLAGSGGVWNNSWVRFPADRLNHFARQVLGRDLLADKREPTSNLRADSERFVFRDSHARETVRVPVSYLLKLALADAIGAEERMPYRVSNTAWRLMDHFLNDNTSPETHSFYVTAADRRDGLGRALAKETSLRYLLTQLLLLYANDRFGLKESGQEAVAYFSPNAPCHQRQLNDCIPDAFYRELFMSPCLSGWDQGENKRDYMHLCHQVLSRSQLYAIAKVREAGLVVGNLMVLPNPSNICLANNGIHVSLGSRKLTGLLSDPSSGFGAAEEKCVGDLVTKIVEHFLPLFVGTYSAAPYRLDFTDFHAEKALGFLPHELDFTHLRMLWRRWKKKVHLTLFGQPITPSGYEWLDRMLSTLFRLRGDFVPDYRLIDYLAAPLSTDESPALDGTPGNWDRLKRDLADQGVFDGRMAWYTLYRLRSFATMGYSGFEARYYSLCESLEHDLGRAVDLQNLVTALAYKYVVEGRVTHADIPDDPSVESERRQIFFGTAIELPTFFVRAGTKNAFLRRIIAKAARTRSSHRYPGYVRLYHLEYRRALVATLRHDAASLIEAFRLEEMMADLEARVETPHRHGAVGRLTQPILEQLGVRSPLHVPAAEFNRVAERHYREGVRRRHIDEALHFLHEETHAAAGRSGESRRYLASLGIADDVNAWITSTRTGLLAGELPPAELQKLIQLMLVILDHKLHATDRGHFETEPMIDERDPAPIC